MSLSIFAQRFTPCLYERYLNASRRQQWHRIEKILSRSTPPQPLDSETLFATLQGRRYPKPATYDYSEFSCFKRAAERLITLSSRLPDLVNPHRILEVSCGDGLTGYLLSEAGHDVNLTDIEDWRFPKARSLPFIQADICSSFSQELGQFDAVIAFNATEHWDNPEIALYHLLKMCCPNGVIFLEFGPLFNSPWGLHAWSFNFPYAQFLFSRTFITDKVRSAGVMDLGNNRDSLQETNGWSLHQFRNLWNSLGCRVEHIFEDRDMRYLDIIEEFPNAFCGRKLTLEEVSINSIEIVLRKPLNSTTRII